MCNNEAEWRRGWRKSGIADGARNAHEMRTRKRYENAKIHPTSEEKFILLRYSEP